MTAPPTAIAAPAQASAAGEEAAGPPALSYGQLFGRFLRFGLLAWGGPVAQIAMLREELVEEERWVSRRHFNRVLAVYQVLPGPEAHELCVYFGYLARGRLGGLLAAALLRRLVEERGMPLEVTCAGTDPDPAIMPHVRALLAQEGLALPIDRPQLATPAQLAGADYVISLGCTLDELAHPPARWELWDDVPPPSQNLRGAYARIQQHLATWIAAHITGPAHVETR